jgi:hypothetical protein
MSGSGSSGCDGTVVKTGAVAGGAVGGGSVTEPEGVEAEQAVRTTSSEPNNTPRGNQRDLCVARLNEIAVLP